MPCAASLTVVEDLVPGNLNHVISMTIGALVNFIRSPENPITLLPPPLLLDKQPLLALCL